MASTYEPIATTTLGSAQASVTLNSFSGYTDLILVARARTTDGNYRNLLALPNNNSAPYSSSTYVGGETSAYSGRRTNQTVGMQIGYCTASSDSNFTELSITHFMNYANTTTYKTALTRYGGSNSNQVNAQVGLWQSTSAITSLVLSTSSGNLDAGSTFTLYGIKSA